MLAAIVVWLVWPATSPDGNLQIRPLTAMPGRESFPSISPDGNYVVFSWVGPDLGASLLRVDNLARVDDATSVIAAAQRAPA